LSAGKLQWPMLCNFQHPSIFSVTINFLKNFSYSVLSIFSEQYVSLLFQSKEVLLFYFAFFVVYWDRRDMQFPAFRIYQMSMAPSCILISRIAFAIYIELYLLFRHYFM